MFGVRDGTLNTTSLIEFRTDPREHLDDQPVTSIWDGPPAHRSKDLIACPAIQRHWLRMEPLAAYARDLNPMELA
ncbi:hypothetical protein BCF44_1396 [Kutzneria buriramensis]|uniref:DDE superfamily endonuclease n=1 Tax=Kutzneria buriramensis TaxID=1045776 RepID=A0A3E0G5U7_9PSEU|nr:hypothetical protein BCF44_1396 [Kutzneria buriramensis]